MSKMASIVATIDPSLKIQKGNVIRILHVDDDASIQEISKLVLTDINENFCIDNACSVDEAFKKLGSEKYDIIVSDYEMPQKNGLEFLKSLREQNNGTPFILFTGKGREEVAVKALNLGAEGYYNKQGDPETVYGELAHGIKLVNEKHKAKRALEESERRYSILMDSASDAIFVHDLKGTIVNVNQQACTNLGYSKEELLQMHASEVDGDASNEKIGREYWAKALSGETVTFESLHKRKDQSVFPVEVTLRKVVIEQKDYVMGSTRNITERKKAEQTLKASEARFRSLYDNSLDPILLTIPDGTIISANPSAQKMFGMTEEELKKVGRSGVYVSTEKNMLTLNERENKGKIHAEVLLKRKDNSTFNADLTSNFFVDSDGIAKTCMIIRDITERKKTELEIEEKYAALGKVADNIDAGLLILGKDYRVVWANKKLEKRGFVPNIKCFHSFNRTTVCPGCGVKKVFEENLPIEIHDYRHVSSSGEVTWSELRATPFKDKDGNVVGALELEIPVTERKKTEEMVKETSQIVNSIINSTDDVIYALDRKLNFLYVNKAIAKIVNSSPEQMVGKSLWTIFPECAHTALDKNLCEALERNETRTFVWQGVYNKRYQEFTICPFENGLAVFAKDITERKNAEENLKASEHMFHEFADSLPDIVFEADLTGKLTYANRQALELTGYNKKDIEKGLNILQFTP